MLLLLLLLTWGCCGPLQAAFCPQDCFCREMHTFGVNNVYVVTRYYRNLTKVPDLQQLSEIQIPIYIKLSYSSIAKVSREDFPPGLAVRFLNLGGNRHMEIHEDAFVNLRDSLVYLDLETTKTFFNTTLTFLRGLSKLETLILSFNNVFEYKTITPDVRIGLFRTLGLSSLTKLKMYKCNMESMGYSVFNDVDTIKELDLGANSLKQMPTALQKLPNLEILDLSHSLIFTIRTRTFINSVKLKKLILVPSKIEIIDHDAFEGLESSLEHLDLSGSHLPEIPTAALRNLKALKVFKMDDSMINTIAPNSFSGSYCLEDLSLGKMNIKFNQDMFKGQESCIKSLFLRQINLEDVPAEHLRTLSNLKNLFLDNNEIQELRPEAFAGVKASLLVLKGNPLSTIAKDAFKGAVRPLYLSMEYILIKDLSFVLDYPKGTFESIDVTGVMIKCDCTTARVIKLMENNNLKGNCKNMDTGADIELQTDTVYHYLSRKCPDVMTSGVSRMTVKNTIVTLTFPFVVFAVFHADSQLFPS